MSVPERTAPAPESAGTSAAKAPERRLAVGIALAAGIGLILFALLFALRGRGPGSDVALAYWAAILGLLGAACCAWLFVVQTILRPMAGLAAQMRMIAGIKSDSRIVPAAFAGIRPAAEAAAELAGAFLATHREVQRSVDAATSRVEEQKERLAAILRDLSEGVMVCNLDHQVLLYNQMALSLLHVAGELGLGRSLFNLVTREPVLHALDRLMRRPTVAGPADEGPILLVCATIDSRTLLSGRMSPVLDAEQRPTGYVLTFTDATRDIAEVSRRDALLRDATEGLRAPVANLRAAAEALSAYPNIDPAQRRAFEEVILREGNALTARLEALDREHRGISARHWPMADIHSVDLFGSVIRTLGDLGGPAVTMVGMPLWFHADSHSLALALQRIVLNLAAATGARAFDIEALLGDKRVYVEIAWAGLPLSSAMLDLWKEEPLPGALGSTTLGDVLARHGSEMWSRAERPGRALLRIPLPAADRVQFAPRAETALPPRPEFYDLDLLRFGPAERAAGARPLRALAYVIFDTETTGLKPSEGDEMISIGAVRVVNGRILTGETFSRLINPRRPIPAESTRFHAITDAMVADAPPAEIVLPQFKAFASDAVLVAHNAAFDLKFLRLKQDSVGVCFDNVVLDTLLISALLFPEFPDHSLDTIAGRLQITVAGRHTAIGDAMATAAVFVRLLGLLEARGVDTLDKLLEASKMALAIRARQAAF